MLSLRFPKVDEIGERKVSSASLAASSLLWRNISLLIPCSAEKIPCSAAQEFLAQRTVFVCFFRIEAHRIGQNERNSLLFP
jgi:hypothetical protein